MSAVRLPRSRWLLLGGLLFAMASPCAASGGITSSFSEGWLLAGKIFNAVVLFGGLFLLLRKPLKNFFVHRTAEIRKKLEDAEKARAEAEAKLAEAQARLAALEAEIGRVREQAERDAAAAQDRIARHTEEEMERFRARARIEIESQTKEALDGLRAFAAEQSAEAARRLLRAEIRPEDDAALFERFLQGLGEQR
ncbi:MAG: hypothetical protein KA419_05710 [Acidobacteria bacterium]|nr:hypothetical protein [Acidobacteriota bacterium]